jgi:hypothetical protein
MIYDNWLLSRAFGPQVRNPSLHGELLEPHRRLNIYGMIFVPSQFFVYVYASLSLCLSFFSSRYIISQASTSLELERHAQT